jgi:hypothetical protein
VPVAVNLYTLRSAQNAGGELFRSIQRQKDQYQGIWIFSPRGKVLAAHHDVKSHDSWTQEVLQTIDAALQAFGRVKPRAVKAADPLPHRGAGVLADGRVCLAIYVRHVLGGGRDKAPAAVNRDSLWTWDGALRPDGPPVIDSLTLTDKEWAGFVPPTPTVGTEWRIAQATARKFARAVSASSDQSLMPRPQDAKTAELLARVESVSADHVLVRLAGKWETAHQYEGKTSFGWASAEGVAQYDTGRKTLRSLTLVLSRAFRSPPPYDTADRPTAAVVEWRLEPR